MAQSGLYVPRETAEVVVEREIATDRTFSEIELTALIADNVRRETAERDSTIATLTTEKMAAETASAALQDKVDIAETARALAEKELADYKASVEDAKEIAARKETRVAAVREAAKHLTDEFFTAERAEAWARKTDEDFATYVAELAEVSKGATPVKTGREIATALGGTSAERPKTSTFYTLGKGC